MAAARVVSDRAAFLFVIMIYTIKAHPTRYHGVLFRSRLEARWAAFFDIVGWKWEYEPLDFPGWSPDFYVTIPCRHSECDGGHTLLVEVKPYTDLSQFNGHPSTFYPYGGEPPNCIPAHASASFGYNPSVSHWEMGHGSGGDDECIEQWVNDWESAWKMAGELVQYLPKN